MKFLFALSMMLAGSAAFANTNGNDNFRCGPNGNQLCDNGPAWNGQYAPGYGPNTPAPYTGSPFQHGSGPAGYGPAYTGCVDGTTVAYPMLVGTSSGGKQQYAYVQIVCENNEWVIK